MRRFVGLRLDLPPDALQGRVTHPPTISWGVLASRHRDILGEPLVDDLDKLERDEPLALHLAQNIGFPRATNHR